MDDRLGARPGRTTPLYVLDNDNDPSGEVLAVDSVDASAAVKSMLSISPDGQTVDLKLPAGYAQPVPAGQSVDQVAMANWLNSMNAYNGMATSYNEDEWYR